MKKLSPWLVSFVVFLGCGIAYAQSRPRAPQVGFGALRVFDVTQSPYSALGNNTGNDCPAIQSAINDADNFPNGSPTDDVAVVYLPSGRYRCTTALRLPGGVRLVGDFAAPLQDDWSSTTPTKGTYFYVEVGANTNPFSGQGSSPPFEDDAATDAAAVSPFIQIRGAGDGEAFRNGASVEGIAFFYPSQETDGSPVPYPATIARITGTGAISGLVVRNVTFINSYVALDLNAIDVPIIENISGCPLALGIRIRSQFDHYTMYGVKWHPSIWKTLGDQTLDVVGVGPTNIRTWRARNFVGMMIYRVDAANYSGIVMFEGHRGLYFSDFQQDAATGWSKWDQVSIDGYNIPLEMDAIGLVNISNSDFSTSPGNLNPNSLMFVALLGDGTATGRVDISGTEFRSTGQGIVINGPAYVGLSNIVVRGVGQSMTTPSQSADIISIADTGTGRVTITGSHLEGFVDAGGTEVRTAVRISRSTDATSGYTVTGNTIRRVKTALASITVAGFGGDNIIFDGNRVDAGDPGTLAIDACGIAVNGAGATRAIVISNNNFSGCSDSSTATQTSMIWVDADNVNIVGNVFAGATTLSGDVIHLEGGSTVTRVVVALNSLDQMAVIGGSDGIEVESGVSLFTLLGNVGFPSYLDSSGAVTKYVAGNN